MKTRLTTRMHARFVTSLQYFNTTKMKNVDKLMVSHKQLDDEFIELDNRLKSIERRFTLLEGDEPEEVTI